MSPYKILDYISKTVTETLEGHTSNVSFTLHQLMLLSIAIVSAGETVEREWTGCRLVVWSFKRGRDEPENHFGKVTYTCDSEELTSTLQVAMEDVTPGRSTHSATSKRTCVDRGIRQFH